MIRGKLLGRSRQALSFILLPQKSFFARRFVVVEISQLFFAKKEGIQCNGIINDCLISYSSKWGQIYGAERSGELSALHARGKEGASGALGFIGHGARGLARHLTLGIWRVRPRWPV